MSNAMFDCWMAKKKRYHAPAAITAPIATAKLSPSPPSPHPNVA